MTRHKYVRGEQVELLPASRDFNVPAGSYVIVRPLPIEANLCRYRVKSLRDGHERVLTESEIASTRRDR